MTAIGNYPDLVGRRVLVTGASSGIGLSCARMFLEAGSRVALHCRCQRAPVEALSALHPGASWVVQADLSQEGGCVTLVREAAGRLGGLDVLVHSAGIWNSGSIRTLSRENLESMFATNAFSSYYLARECAAVIERGSLLFIGSTAGQRGEPGHSHYAGSKGAVQSMVYSLAQELAPDIRVN
ncbi:MAG: SDR family oxidoreductase, partial [Acidobacteriota bacterium]